jgi:hypothetical protein
MALINPDMSGIVDGAVGDAADWKTPMNTIINEINGGLDNDNIASDAAIALSKLASDAATTYTPTWIGSVSNPSLGNGTLTAYYIKVGRVVHFLIKLTMGSTTTFGSGTYDFTLPLTASSDYETYFPLGNASGVDAGSGVANGNAIIVDQTKVRIAKQANTTADYGDWAHNYPFTWANGDKLFIFGSYIAES